MKLSHNGVEWAGSFQLALRAVLDDVLTEGPLAGTAEFERDGNPRGRETVAVTMERVSGPLPLVKGGALELAHILSVEF